MPTRAMVILANGRMLAALMEGSPEGVAAALEAGAGVDHEHFFEGFGRTLTTLVLAAAVPGRRCKRRIVKLLLAAGADVNKVCCMSTGDEHDSLTPLMCAVMQDDSCMVKLLLKEGDDVNSICNDEK